MEFKNPIKMQCPYCNYQLTTDKDFAIKNKRVFCGTCCKSFDVQIEENTKNSDWYKKYISLQEDSKKEEQEKVTPEDDSAIDKDDWGFDIPF